MTSVPLEAFTKRIAATQRSDEAQRIFRYGDRAFVVFEGVFSPVEFRSTRIFTANLPYASGRSFLEIGCGAGVTAIVAALSGCQPVVATDISMAAVENARFNARAHGVDDIVTIRQGDLFEPIAEHELFDTIYWNSNFVYAAPDYRCSDDLHRAFIDPGYECHARFLAEAPRHLAPGGSLLLGFSSLGNEELLRNLCLARGYDVAVRCSVVSDMEGNPRYDILRLSERAAVE